MRRLFIIAIAAFSLVGGVTVEVTFMAVPAHACGGGDGC
jgi:hypothetical protein